MSTQLTTNNHPFTDDELEIHQRQGIAFKVLATAARERVARQVVEAERLLEMLVEAVSGDEKAILITELVRQAEIARDEECKSLYGGVVYWADPDRLSRALERFLLMHSVCKAILRRQDEEDQKYIAKAAVKKQKKEPQVPLFEQLEAASREVWKDKK